MNNLTDLCCSFELAKEIYDLGFIRESVFNWAVWQETCMGLTEGIPVAAIKLRDGIEFNMMGFNWVGAGMKLIPAYTVGELGNILPLNIKDKFLTSHKCARNGWWVFYASSGENMSGVEHTAYWNSLEINARARLLIYCIKNKLIEV